MIKIPFLKDKKIKNNLIHLVVSFLLVVITPFLLNSVTPFNLQTTRENSPYRTYNQANEYNIGRVSEILKEEEAKDTFYDMKVVNQTLEVEVITGQESGRKVQIEVQVDGNDRFQKYKQNDEIVVVSTQPSSPQAEKFYFILDRFRLPQMILIAIVVLLTVFLLAGVRGLSALAGLFFSIFVLADVLVPGILSGYDTILLTIGVSVIITFVSLYLAHGFNKRTTVALFSTLFTITITLILTEFVVNLTNLTGYGSEEAFNLKSNIQTSGLNLRGLLISSIVIGSLGVLDDVTVAQASAVEQLSIANPKLSSKELFFRAMRLGREHILSLINTLALAYVGTAMPLVLSFAIFDFSPLWVILNNELISEELTRSMLGSLCLIMGIPISTFLASKYLRVKLIQKSKDFSFLKEVNK